MANLTRICRFLIFFGSPDLCERAISDGCSGGSTLRTLLHIVVMILSVSSSSFSLIPVNRRDSRIEYCSYLSNLHWCSLAMFSRESIIFIFSFHQVDEMFNFSINFHNYFVQHAVKLWLKRFRNRRSDWLISESLNQVKIECICVGHQTLFSFVRATWSRWEIRSWHNEIIFQEPRRAR